MLLSASSRGAVASSRLMTADATASHVHAPVTSARALVRGIDRKGVLGSRAGPRGSVCSSSSPYGSPYSSPEERSRYPPIPPAGVSGQPVPPPSPIYSTPSAPPSPSYSYASSPEPAPPFSTPEPAPFLGSDEVVEKLRKSANFQKSLSYAAFWVQLALTTVSAGILIFGFAVTSTRHQDGTKWLTVVGVLFSFISTFFAHGFLRLARKLQNGGTVNPNWMVSNLLRNSSVNLWGIGITVIGLQASVGTLVAKSLMSASQGVQMYANQQNTVISLDVFSLQASTNTLLCHVIGLVFGNWMLRIVNKAMPKASEAPAFGM